MLITSQADPVKRALVGEFKKAGGRRPSQVTWNAFIKRTLRLIEGLGKRLEADEINLATYQKQFLDVLEDAHVQAGVYGRQKAGDISQRSPSDIVWALRVMREETEYFNTFIEQIRAKDKRYVDEYDKLRVEQITSRAKQYTPKLRGTANNVYVMASPQDALYDWVMLNNEHCSECPTLQEGSPYTQATLLKKPGEGKTPCRHNCGCVLVRYFADDRMPPDIGFARMGDPPPDMSEFEDMPDLFGMPDTGDFFAV